MNDDNSNDDDLFLPRRGNYEKLIVYQKAECIYDITYHFCHRFFPCGDRTIDQMVQAARSGKQNIVEGSADSATSAEGEIKLMGVSRGSLQELLCDYKDYLRVRGLELWPLDSEKTEQTRRVCAEHNDSAFYRERMPQRSDETIANIAITLIHQTDAMMGGLLDSLQRQFVNEGGTRERMSKARRDKRGY